MCYLIYISAFTGSSASVQKGAFLKRGLADSPRSDVPPAWMIKVKADGNGPRSMIETRNLIETVLLKVSVND